MMLVGLGLCGVLANDVQALLSAVLHGLEHLRERPAELGTEFDAPLFLESPTDRVVVLVLEAREAVRDRAHIAASLHVILATKGIQTRPIRADMAGQQREIDKTENIIDRVVVLR